MSECQHPEESWEYDPGNWVPPYGWEQWPGWYCHDCGDTLDEKEWGLDEDPDVEYKYRKENEGW